MIRDAWVLATTVAWFSCILDIWWRNDGYKNRSHPYISAGGHAITARYLLSTYRLISASCCSLTLFIDSTHCCSTSAQQLLCTGVIWIINAIMCTGVLLIIDAIRSSETMTWYPVDVSHVGVEIRILRGVSHAGVEIGILHGTAKYSCTRYVFSIICGDKTNCWSKAKKHFLKCKATLLMEISFFSPRFQW